jgi:hypothetical protein
VFHIAERCGFIWMARALLSPDTRQSSNSGPDLGLTQERDDHIGPGVQGSVFLE